MDGRGPIGRLWMRFLISAAILISFGGCIERLLPDLQQFQLEDGARGIFVYKGKPIDVDGLIVYQKYVKDPDAAEELVRSSPSTLATPEALDRVISRASPVLWLVGAKKAQKWSNMKVQYGVAPPGFEQRIPERGPAPQLVEGQTYVIAAPPYNPKCEILACFVIRNGKFALPCARFTLSGPKSGPCVYYSGDPVDVDTIMVEQYFRPSETDLFELHQIKQESPEAMHGRAARIWSSMFRVVWLVKARVKQTWSNNYIQYGVPPPGFEQVIPQNGAPARLAEGQKYLITAGVYRAGDSPMEKRASGFEGYQIHQLLVFEHGEFKKTEFGK